MRKTGALLLAVSWGLFSLGLVGSASMAFEMGVQSDHTALEEAPDWSVLQGLDSDVLESAIAVLMSTDEDDDTAAPYQGLDDKPTASQKAPPVARRASSAGSAIGKGVEKNDLRSLSSDDIKSLLERFSDESVKRIQSVRQDAELAKDRLEVETEIQEILLQSTRRKIWLEVTIFLEDLWNLVKDIGTVTVSKAETLFFRTYGFLGENSMGLALIALAVSGILLLLVLMFQLVDAVIGPVWGLVGSIAILVGALMAEPLPGRRYILLSACIVSCHFLERSAKRHRDGRKTNENLSSSFPFQRTRLEPIPEEGEYEEVNVIQSGTETELIVRSVVEDLIESSIFQYQVSAIPSKESKTIDQREVDAATLVHSEDEGQEPFVSSLSPAIETSYNVQAATAEKSEGIPTSQRAARGGGDDDE